MNNNDENVFMTTKEISEYLRIPLSTIYRLTKNGSIKGIKIGKQWRYSKTDIEKYFRGGIDTVNAHLNEFTERRVYPRMNCNFQCKSSIHIEGLKEICEGECTVANVSAGGVYLKNIGCCLEKTDIGDPIDMDFSLVSDIDETTHDIHAKGRVVRKTYEGIGVKFRHIKDEYKDIITDFID